VRAVVFDIGGVLEITPFKLARPPGGPDVRLEDGWAGGAVGAISEADVHRRIGEILGLDEPGVDAFMADLWTEYLGTLNAELAEFFGNLRPRFQTAILSNSFVGAREKEQELYGFEELTDLIVYSHEVGMSKPDPRIYHLTCDRLGVTPDEALFVDDVPEYVAAAQAIGMRGVRYLDNAQTIADIEAQCPP
jgi:putative hydrolase of the HAD superfamily